MKNLKRILFFIAGICLLMACSKSDNFWGDDCFGHKGKIGKDIPKPFDKYAPGTSYNLSGLALYKTWKVKDGTLIQDHPWPCTATLEFLEGRDFKYTFTEERGGDPMDNPSLECYGKISASGILTFKFPAPLWPDGLYITDIIREHACAKIWGEGINEGTLVFKGKFDGTEFTATAKFMALIEEYCPNATDLFPTPVDGPLRWIFGYDLTVD
jgi:hypothetical protein